MVIPLYDRNPTRRVPVVTIALILLNVAVFFFVQPHSGERVLGLGGSSVQISRADAFNYEHAAIPCELRQGSPLRLDEVETGVHGPACGAGGPELFAGKNVWFAALASMFLHVSLLHLAGNMLFLWVFGNNVEDRLGRVRYIVFYLLAGLVALGSQLLVDPSSTVPIIGASGAIAGVMGAYLMWFPTKRVLSLLVIFPVELPAYLVLVAWFVMQFFTDPNAGVAWVAHVGGFVGGALFAFLARGRTAPPPEPLPPFTPPPPRWTPPV
ncbi:MAG: putative rane protein [Actinomycetia bacterium]|nr:putative rane protein [Actinomycetes bacterium]